MPYKIGGGGLPQLYDPKNGQYTDEEKHEILNNELENMVKRYKFGMKDTYVPQFPIVGFHSNEYCEIYVKHTICDLLRFLPYEKIQYLLTYKIKDDKSIFFNLLGYKSDLIGRNELYEQIFIGSDFANMKFDRLDKYGIFVNVPTKIYHKIKQKYV